MFKVTLLGLLHSDSIAHAGDITVLNKRSYYEDSSIKLFPHMSQAAEGSAGISHLTFTTLGCRYHHSLLTDKSPEV